MKSSKGIRWAVAVAVCLIVAFGLGPRPRLTEPDGAGFIEGEVGAYLEAGEARVAGLKPGARKEIVWADPDTRKRTPYALVYLHGFSSSSGETRPLADLIAKRLGANLFYARLAGHGIEGDGLAGVTADDWLKDAAEALAVGKELGESVVLMAASTGAPLALWLCGRDEDRLIAGVVLMSPNFGLRDKRTEILTWPWMSKALALAVGSEVSFAEENDAVRRVWTTRYPLATVAQMMALVKYGRRLPLEEIATPALVLYSPSDQIVDPAAALAVFERLGSKSKRLIEVLDTEDPVAHVLAGAVKSPGNTERLADEIAAFIDSL